MKKIRPFFIFFIVFGIVYYGCQKINHANELPLVITGDTSNIKANSVTITGTVTTNDAPVQTSGHVWSSINQLPTYSANEGRTTIRGLLPQNKIISILNALSPGKTYFIRGYVISDADTVYGNVITFLTTAISQAAISTGAVSNIKLTSADVAAVITSTGNAPVTQHGIVWSKTNQNPTTTDSISLLGALAAPVSYTSTLSNLSPGTFYYARAYLVNSAGILYGNVVSFSTLSNDAPSVSTDSVINISVNSATAKGSIINIGNSPVTQYGHVWSSVNNLPTINDSKSQLGAANAPTSFSSSLAGLTAGTKYYVRAYAINNAGVSYGAVDTFTISSTNNLPVVYITSVYNINVSSVSSDGSITDFGSSPIIQYGHVYSSSNNLPTVNDNKTQLGTPSFTPIGFTSYLSGLAANTTYYIRSYATNSAGTAYSNTVLTFTTFPAQRTPTVTTGTVSSITSNSVNITGNITDAGYPAVRHYGHSWVNTNSQSTSQTDLGVTSVPISYTSSLTGLDPGTLYYVFAYALNDLEGRGATIGFTTLVGFVSNSVSTITTNSATASASFKNDGRSPISQYGHVWSSTNNIPTLTSNDNKTINPYQFNSTLSGLTPNTTYYVSAYIINDGGTSYSNVATFTTLSTVNNNPPSITTGDPFYQPPGVANAIVVFPGTITSTGSFPVTEHGHVWSKTNTIPTLSDSFNQLGAASTGNYNSIFSPNVITPGTYYVRAYATNSSGTSFGAVKTFSY